MNEIVILRPGGAAIQSMHMPRVESTASGSRVSGVCAAAELLRAFHTTNTSAGSRGAQPASQPLSPGSLPITDNRISANGTRPQQRANPSSDDSEAFPPSFPTCAVTLGLLLSRKNYRMVLSSNRHIASPLRLHNQLSMVQSRCINTSSQQPSLLEI